MKKMFNSNNLHQFFHKKSAKTEKRLIQRAIGGDKEAFSQLYTQYVNAIYGFMFSRVSEGMIAEDLTSQVFLKAWENIGQFHDKGIPLRAWLFRIARNTLIDHYRSTNTHECLDHLPANEPEPEADVEEVIKVHMEEIEIIEAMDHLTDEQRRAICLKFLDGVNNRDIARRMGKRRGAIRALQMRGLQTLEKILKKPEHDISKR